MADYDEYVDGRPRYHGCAHSLIRGRSTFRGLAERSVFQGDITGLGNRRNEIVLAMGTTLTREAGGS